MTKKSEMLRNGSIPSRWWAWMNNEPSRCNNSTDAWLSVTVEGHCGGQWERGFTAVSQLLLCPYVRSTNKTYPLWMTAMGTYVQINKINDIHYGARMVILDWIEDVKGVPDQFHPTLAVKIYIRFCDQPSRNRGEELSSPVWKFQRDLTRHQEVGIPSANRLDDDFL